MLTTKLLATICLTLLAAGCAVAQSANTVQPLLMTCRDIGGSDFCYDSASGAGQCGFVVWRWIVLDNGDRLRVHEKCPGLNNVGLLIRVSGRVSWTSASEFYLDDGSEVDDFDVPDTTAGRPPGVKVRVPDGVAAPLQDAFVTITGVVSCEKVGNEIRRLILVRMQDDIIPY